MTREQISNRIVEIYLAAGTLMFVGWGGMLALLLFTVPTVDARWMFFVLGLSALTGTSILFRAMTFYFQAVLGINQLVDFDNQI